MTDSLDSMDNAMLRQDIRSLRSQIDQLKAALGGMSHQELLQEVCRLINNQTPTQASE